MKLISKFHDYYDTALAFGRDEDVLYIRERSQGMLALPSDLVPWDSPGRYGRRTGPLKTVVYETHHARMPRYSVDHFPEPMDLGSRDLCIEVHEAFVVLAGKAYPVWLEPRNGEVLLEGMKSPPIGSPTIDSYRTLVAERHAVHPRRARGEEADIVVQTVDWREEDRQRYDEARKRFLAYDFTSLHIDQGAPIFLLAAKSSVQQNWSRMDDVAEKATAQDLNVAMIRNPCLKDLGFQRTLDPQSCFQSIAQFIGGVMPGKQMPMVQLDDKHMVQKKGFDPKYSFRTRPQ